MQREGRCHTMRCRHDMATNLTPERRLDTPGEQPSSTTALPRLFTEEEAARQLTVSKATLGRLRRGGRIAFRRIGEQVRYTQSDISEYIETCLQKRQTSISNSVPASGRARGPSPADSLAATQLLREIVGKPRRPRLGRSSRTASSSTNDLPRPLPNVPGNGSRS